MTRKLREFKRSFGQEKARVKLYKSGKNWVKAGIKEIQLLRLMGLPFLTEKVEKDVEGPQNIGGFIKRNALKTTALTGGMFTVNMLHDQNVFAASEAPVTSELTTQSQTVGDQTSVVIEQSQSSTDSQSATSTTSETSTSTASESNTSENSQSTSADSQSRQYEHERQVYYE
ncbi:KxYKxGKxW signal peptide domain-containing protein [Staphylococcus agnetis]|uniref:KxYKxGKxW signal peptide domain-containing protein n=1 Tax=Staphylococcus agnetis TaxID=985762 RepID=UPI00208FF260|nr:KxYKxGKxW signal peptide domain-containing protein [Staphylococcus agnetis]MCO4325630.1 KxYKxGKxW signal peptide domain-containing protein [Staphylococcus agnetis]MCO4369387.1 KxYKxGKxW signal peptide domain-containing protein [Staphylococcus agnetis]